MEDLKEIGVDLLGHRRKIINEVGRLNNNMPSGILLNIKKILNNNQHILIPTKSEHETKNGPEEILSEGMILSIYRFCKRIGYIQN